MVFIKSVLGICKERESLLWFFGYSIFNPIYMPETPKRSIETPEHKNSAQFDAIAERLRVIKNGDAYSYETGSWWTEINFVRYPRTGGKENYKDGPISVKITRGPNGTYTLIWDSKIMGTTVPTTKEIHDILQEIEKKIRWGRYDTKSKSS